MGIRQSIMSCNAGVFYALLTTLTHELAHALERKAHHGREWRNTHAMLLSAVCAHPVAAAAEKEQKEQGHTKRQYQSGDIASRDGKRIRTQVTVDIAMGAGSSSCQSR